MANNARSVIDNPQVIRQLVKDEHEKGRVIGPFDLPPFDRFHTSPLSLKAKKEPGKFRLVLDLAYPYDQTSVNYNIPDEVASVRYTSFDSAIDMLLQTGRHSYMAKADIKSAFRILPIHPDDYRFLGFSLDHQFYFDACLLMGAASSCSLFEAFATAFHWIIRNKLGLVNSLHYLDDWFFVESSHSACQYDIRVFKHIAKKLGIPLAPEKQEGPSTVITFLGIELDSDRMEARIPRDKLDRYRNQLDRIVQSDVTTMGDLRTLAGKLNWTLSIITSGRAFLRRLYDSYCHITNPLHTIVINEGLRRDLVVWQRFLSNYNGKHFLMYYPVQDANEINLHADASFKAGAATFKNEWIRIEYPESWSNKGITFLELFPLVAMLDLKASYMRDSKIILHTDNYAAMNIINSQTAKPEHIMHLVRHLVLLSLRHNLRIVAKHVPGKLNNIPDALSRFQEDQEMLESAGLNPNPTPTGSAWDPHTWTARAGTY